jgi:hypothetical protein
VADGSGHVKQGSDLVDDHALRRLFRALERHRPLERHGHQLVFRGSHSRRPGRRYESLLVAAAVGRLQRDCLSVTTDSEGGRSEVEGVLLAEVEQELQDHERASEQLGGWLPSIVRGRAEARARKRFEAIVAEVTTEVGVDVPGTLIPRQPVADEPSVFGPSADQETRGAEAEPKPEPAAESSRCTALTRRGTRCSKQAGTGGLCELHARIAAGPAPAVATEETSDQVAPDHRDSGGIHADTVWAVGGFVLVAAVLAWAGVPVSEDAPVGSSVVVGKTTAPAATGFESTTVALLHDASARDARVAERDAPARSRDGGRAPNRAERDGGETATPTDVSAPTDTLAAAPIPDAAPEPSQPSEGTQDDGGAPDPNAGGGGGGGGQPDPVRGELVDEMLGRP